MNDQLEALRREFPEFTRDYAPPWGLATTAMMQELETRYGCRLPASYVSYCTDYARQLPADNSFLWPTAHPPEDTYASLEAGIDDARQGGVPTYYFPFWSDESNYLCFDTRQPNKEGEYPVIFWEHDDPANEPRPSYESFAAWLRSRLRQYRERMNRQEQ